MPNGRFSSSSLPFDCLPSLSVCYKPCNSSLSLNLVAFCAKTSWRKKKMPHWDEDSTIFIFWVLSFFRPSSHQMSCIHPFHIHPSDDIIDRRSGLELSLWITWSEFRGEPSDSVAGAKTSASGACHPFFPPSLFSWRHKQWHRYRCSRANADGHLASQRRKYDSSLKLFFPDLFGYRTTYVVNVEIRLALRCFLIEEWFHFFHYYKCELDRWRYMITAPCYSFCL